MNPNHSTSNNGHQPYGSHSQPSNRTPFNYHLTQRPIAPNPASGDTNTQMETSLFELPSTPLDLLLDNDEFYNNDGSNSTVHKVTSTLGNSSALKLAKAGREAWKWQREINCLKQAQGERNVITLLSSSSSPTKRYILTELCMPGNFLHLLEKRGALTLLEVRHFALQLLDGIQAMQIKSIIHRDLRPENILVASGMVLKVADFGSATMAGANTIFAAPECILRRPQDYKVDIFSFGVIMCMMLSGRVPNITLSDKVLRWNDDFYKIFTKSECGRHFLARALEIDANRRASVSELYNHCFLKVGHCPATLPESVFGAAPTTFDNGSTGHEEICARHGNNEEIDDEQVWPEVLEELMP
ncbi:hypothetical protein BGW39_001067 [Mortierella sp. 14UC]|nr:hypothetical protein BGW39_001067 [Mortierella sp. 14UC]